MKAIVLEKPGSFALTDVPDNAELPVGSARVRIRRVGICGTDWHAYHGRQPFFSYPRILGHELGVEVEAVNDPASDLSPGDRCSVEPYINCGTCIACRRGKSNCCEKLSVLGVHVDGGMRDHLVLPARKLHPSTKLTLDQLALVETLGIGCHAVARAGITADDVVLVLGAGPIGLATLPFIQAVKAKAVVADVSATRLAFCREQMKVDQTIDAQGDLVAKVKSTLADLPTVVIDATGNPQSMARCFDLVCHGGKIVFVGLFQGEVSFNDPNFHRREMTLLASRNALPADFSRIIKLIEEGTVDTTPWITHRAAAGDLVGAIPGWLSPDAGLLKAIVEF